MLGPVGWALGPEQGGCWDHSSVGWGVGATVARALGRDHSRLGVGDVGTAVRSAMGLQQ